MAFKPTHIIEYLQVCRYEGWSFTPGGTNTDEYIVRRMVDSIRYPEYGLPQKIAGWRVIDAETGRVLDSENWIQK